MLRTPLSNQQSSGIVFLYPQSVHNRISKGYRSDLFPLSFILGSSRASSALNLSHHYPDFSTLTRRQNLLVLTVGFEPTKLLILSQSALPICPREHINVRFISQPYIKYYSIYFLKSQQKNIYHKAKRRMKKTAIVII